MYAPFLFQAIITGVHFLLFVGATVFYNFNLSKKTVLKWIYNVLLILATLINIVLLFSGTMGVGAAGYDDR